MHIQNWLNIDNRHPPQHNSVLSPLTSIRYSLGRLPVQGNRTSISDSSIISVNEIITPTFPSVFQAGVLILNCGTCIEEQILSMSWSNTHGSRSLDIAALGRSV